MDVNDQIATNVGLVYQQLHRFKLSNDQDAESYAYEALHKAVITFNSEAGAAFSTYATCVIANALRVHLRKLNKKRQLHIVSYDEPVSPDDDDQRCLVDTIIYNDTAESTVIEKELREAVNVAFNKVFKTLSPTHSKVVTMWYKSKYDMSQKEIAEALHITQATVSIALSSFKHKLRMELEEYL